MSQIQIILQHLTKYSSFTSLDLSLHLYTHCVYTVTLNFHLFCVLFLFCSQNGTRAGCVLKKQMDQAKLQEIQARIDEVRNRDFDTIEETDENNNTLCSNDASRQVSWWSVLSACVALCCLLSGSCGFWNASPSRKEVHVLTGGSVSVSVSSLFFYCSAFLKRSHISPFYSHQQGLECKDSHL